MKRIKKLVATTGEYTAADGSTKKRYVQVGSVFAGDDGRTSIKIDSVPVGSDWNGWLSVYPLDEQQQAPSQAAPAESEIPF